MLAYLMIIMAVSILPYVKPAFSDGRLCSGSGNRVVLCKSVIAGLTFSKNFIISQLALVL